MGYWMYEGLTVRAYAADVRAYAAECILTSLVCACNLYKFDYDKNPFEMHFVTLLNMQIYQMLYISWYFAGEMFLKIFCVDVTSIWK